MVGAGFSQSVGMPGTDEITKRMMTGKDIFRCSDGRYLLNSSTPYEMTSEELSRLLHAQVCARYLKLVLDQYYLPRQREPNYEDVYQYAGELLVTSASRYGNPLNELALNEFRRQIPALFHAITASNPESCMDAYTILDECCNYIVGVVVGMLNRGYADRTNHLQFLCDLHESSEVERVDIFSLCHDRVLSNFFHQKKIEFTDGFEAENDEIPFWKTEILANCTRCLTVLQLHGSMDWHGLQYQVTPSYIDEKGIHSGEWTSEKLSKVLYKTEGYKDSSDKHWTANTRPLILVGIQNKLFAYLRGAYRQMYFHMMKSLAECSSCWIMGYGFRDTGINVRLFDFMSEQRDGKLRIVHPKPEALEHQLHIVFPEKYIKEWKSTERLKFIEKDIKNFTYKNFEGLL